MDDSTLATVTFPHDVVQDVQALMRFLFPNSSVHAVVTIVHDASTAICLGRDTFCISGMVVVCVCNIGSIEFPVASVFAFIVDCSLSPAPLASVFFWSQAMWNMMLEEWGSREMAGETCLPRICVYCLYFL